MLLSCPHCNVELDIASELSGQTVQCPACSGRIQIPKKDENAKSSSTKVKRFGWEEGDHANVNFLKCLGIGTALSVIFFLSMIPFRSSTIGGIILDRGWVNYAESFLFIWGMVILYMKWKKNQHQSQATLLQLLPEKLGDEINSSNVGKFIDHIYRTPDTLRDSLIVNRMRKALELFETRMNNGEVASFLSSQSDIDANRSSGSYSLLKVFLWAIPILGFIGTVQGLGVAVASLAMGDTSDPEALKSSINSLTGGLGVAFDTTLLGLILSMFMSFPMSAVQKKEDETLTLIDSLCAEKLLPKLNDSNNLGADSLIEQAENIPHLVSSLVRAHESLQTTHETFLVNLNQSTQLLNQVSETLHTRLNSHQEFVESSFATAINQLSETSDEVFKKSHLELTRTFENIATGVNLINGALRDLKTEQIPSATKKKRFFGLFN